MIINVTFRAWKCTGRTIRHPLCSAMDSVTTEMSAVHVSNHSVQSVGTAVYFSNHRFGFSRIDSISRIAISIVINQKN